MISPDQILTWKDIGTAGAVAISALVAWVAASFSKRLDEHEEKNEETFKEIFDGQKEISAQVQNGFRDMQEKLAETHVKLLERINDAQQDWHKQ